MLKWTVFQNLWYFILGSDISHIYISTEQKFSSFNVHRNHLGNFLKMQVPGYQSPKDYNFLGLGLEANKKFALLASSLTLFFGK